MPTYPNTADGYIDFAMHKLARERDEAAKKQIDEADATRQASGMTDTEIRRVFGATSQAHLANKLALTNMPLYRACKAEATTRGIF